MNLRCVLSFVYKVDVRTKLDMLEKNTIFQIQQTFDPELREL